MNNFSSNIHKVFWDCDLTEWRGQIFLPISGTPVWCLAHSRDSNTLNQEMRNSWFVILSQEESRTENFWLCYIKMKAVLSGLWIYLKRCLVWSNRWNKSIVQSFFGFLAVSRTDVLAHIKLESDTLSQPSSLLSQFPRSNSSFP